jgi:obg-like ATPase 1
LNQFQAEGKYRQQGKNYTVEDGDIIYFKVNAGGGLGGSKK